MVVLLLPIQSSLASSSPKTLVVHSGTACVTGDLYFNLPSEALSSANPGDRIIICPGTYHDNLKVEKSNVIIEGNGDPSSVKIEALNSTQHVIELRNVRNVTIKNVTVSGALGSQIAGIYAQLSSESIIKNVIALDNYFGVDIVSSSNMTLENIEAVNNTNVGINLEGTVISSLNNSTSKGNRIGLLLLFSNNLQIDGINATGNSEGGFLLKYSVNNTLSHLLADLNGWYGIYLQDSDGNELSESSAINNTASGSDGYGLYLYLKSENNKIYNITSSYNVYGMALASSSSKNNITNSSIVNNTIAGIYIENSDENSVIASIKGSMYGVWVQDSNENKIGGEVEACRWGIFISGLDGSSGNVIKRAKIHDNTYSGIVIEGNGSKGNVITGISSYNNTLLGIDLAGDYVTPNDGLLSEGPNDLMDYPVIKWAAIYGDRMIVSGYINKEGNETGDRLFDNATVEIYQSDNDRSGYGEGMRYLGSLESKNGEFLGWIDLPPDISGHSINITGTATLLTHGTSEFGPTVAAPIVSTNLTISKSINPSTVLPNSTAEVLLLLRNYGNGTAYNVTVVDELPDGMEYKNGTSKVNGNLMEPEIKGNNLTWRVDVPSHSEVRIEFNVTVTASPGTTLKNVAVFEGNDGRGNDTDEINVIAPPIINAVKQVSPGVIDVNGTAHYKVILSNGGGLPALLLVKDEIPNGMKYVDNSLASNISLSGSKVSGSIIEFNLTLNPGKSASISYSLRGLAEGRKENKLYVNGSFVASASVIVRDPPSGGSSGSNHRTHHRSPNTHSGGAPPPCSWFSYGQRDKDNSTKDEENEVKNYRLDHPPIVLVSLGSSGVKVSQVSGEQSSSVTENGKSVGKTSSRGSNGKGIPMIVVDITATPAQAETGTVISFLVEVSNIGDGPKDNLSLIVDLSNGLDYIKGSSMMGGIAKEPDNNDNKLSWNLGSLYPGKAIEVSFRAKLLATSGQFNVKAIASSSSDSVTVTVRPKPKPKVQSPPPPPPAVVNLKASSTTSGDEALIRIALTSPTGAKGVRIIATLNNLTYVAGSAKIENMPAGTEANGNTLRWIISISKGGSAALNFKVRQVDEETSKGVVRIYLPGFGKSAEVKVTFEPKQRGVAPPSFNIKLPAFPSVPWWLIFLPLIAIPIFLAYRKREGKGRIVMDYEALKWAARRGLLSDLVEEYEILIPTETFNKVSKDRDLMPIIEKYIVDRHITVEKAPRRKIMIKGIEEDLPAALGLADREKLPVYIGEEYALKDLKRRGFDVRLIREAPPPIKIDMP